MGVPLVGGAGFLSLGAQLNPGIALGLVMMGAAVGAAFVVGLHAVRRRPRRAASANQRLVNLDSLAVEHPPVREETSPRPDRPETGPSEVDAAIAARFAAIVSDLEPRESSIDPGPVADVAVEPVDEPAPSSRPIVVSIEHAASADAESSVVMNHGIIDDAPPATDEVDHADAELPRTVGLHSAADSSVDESEPIDESVLSDLTSDEVATVFNRYEHLVRDELDAPADDGRDIEAEIWRDLTRGDTMPYVATARRNAEGLWVHLHSGQIVCKLDGSDVWISAEDRMRESMTPTFTVSIGSEREPIEVVISIVADPVTEHSRGSEPIPAQSQWSTGRRSP